MTTFAELTSLRVGGPIAEFHEVTERDELVDVVRASDEARRELLILGGGSNLLVSDRGFDGAVVKIATSGVDEEGPGCFRCAAGHNWDQLVESTVRSGYTGLEALSGIPGTVGAAPIQNVGAYGGLTSDVLTDVTLYDRETGAIERWPRERLGFGPHRSSIFKHSRRWVILDVGFQLPTDALRPVRYQALADELGVAVGDSAPAADIRAGVLALRRRRGMVLDEADHDTWSVGSFFLNPVVDEVPAAAADAPQWAEATGTKLSAAWLIERAGFGRGFGAEVGTGRVTLSSKHTLALSNRGGATAEDVLALARIIRDGVEKRYGIVLEPECHLINCSL